MNLFAFLILSNRMPGNGEKSGSQNSSETHPTVNTSLKTRGLFANLAIKKSSPNQNLKLDKLYFADYLVTSRKRF
jgi:hypothetical protein